MASLLKICHTFRNTVTRVRSPPVECSDSLEMYHAGRQIGRLRVYLVTPLQTQSEVPAINAVFSKTTIRTLYVRTKV